MLAQIMTGLARNGLLACWPDRAHASRELGLNALAIAHIGIVQHQNPPTVLDRARLISSEIPSHPGVPNSSSPAPMA